jgi:hypothetical protein
MILGHLLQFFERCFFLVNNLFVFSLLNDGWVFRILSCFLDAALECCVSKKMCRLGCFR